MDDALPKKNFFVNIFLKKLASGGGGDEKNFFRTLKKRSPKKFFTDIKQLKVKNFFRTYTNSIKIQKIFFGQIPVQTCMKLLFF
jgi:hypothetical protein